MNLDRTYLGIPLARWMMLVAAIALLGVFSAWLREALELEWSVESLRQAVDAAGIWGPILYVGILMFRFAILVPSSILLTGAGICFGPVHGTLYATIGLTLSALLKFTFASIVGRDFLIRQLPPAWRSGATVGDRRSTATGLALICAYPLGPNHVFQVAAILAGMSLGRYLVAVSSGAAFRASAFSFFGEALVTGNELLLFSALLAATAAIPLLVPSWRRWLFAAPDGTGAALPQGAGSEAQ